MDKGLARETLNRRLGYLARERQSAQERFDSVSLEIGATTTYLRDVLGQPTDRSVERVGLEFSQLAELMERAGEAGTQIDDPLQRIARVKEPRLLKSFLGEHGPIRRIVASFSSSDMLYMSGVHPSRLLVVHSGTSSIEPANMMIQAEDGEWIAVAGVSFGYVGAGSRDANSLLRHIGLDEGLSKKIAGSRVSDVRFDGPEVIEADHSQDWPRYPIARPEVRGDAFVILMFADDLLNPSEVSDGGFYPRGTGRTTFADCLRILDGQHEYPTPEWLLGFRRGRLYFDRDRAIEDGYVDGSGRAMTFILEQGDLQLWVDTRGWLEGPKIYPVLSEAGFKVDRLQAQEQRGTLKRLFLDRGQSEPFVDLETV